MDDLKTVSTFLLSWILSATLSMADPAVTMPQGFAPLVEKVSPAVVDIDSTEALSDKTGIATLEELRDLKEFQERQLGKKESKFLPTGSGFIVDSTGNTALIVTNFHVIANASELIVKVNQGGEQREYKAEKVGQDRRTDIAVLRIKTDQKLPTLDLADSSKVREGELVIAIGNPFGFGSTVTSGIVSKRGRDISEATRHQGIGEYVTEFIQTNAAINAGNSGGPLINMEGKVIGVNAIPFSNNGGSLGIAFAIPSNIVKSTVEQTKKYGRTRRGWLGVAVQTVTEDLAESLALGKVRGVIIGSVHANGPGAKAGLQEEDVILSIDGTPIKDCRQVPQVVGELPVGKTIPIVIWRQGQEISIKVTVGDYEEAEEQGFISSPFSAEIERRQQEKGDEMWGMTLQDINPRNRQFFGLAEDTRGVLVSRVKRDGQAGEKGLHPGDVIVKIDRTKVFSVAQFKEKIAEAKKNNRKAIALLVNRFSDLSIVIGINLEETSK